MDLTLRDQLSRTVTPGKPEKGIVSVVPSQTELLYALGAGQFIKGVTKFCLYPEEKIPAPAIVGGTKKLHLEKIAAMDPALIVANKEENTRADIEWLADRFPVYVSDVSDLNDAYEMIEHLARFCNAAKIGETLVNKIKSGFSTLQPSKNYDTLYLIWKDPLMAAGKGTFIDEMMINCGFNNIAVDTRYPDVEMTELEPELILLSSEPYPFDASHITYFKQRYPSSNVILVDGTYFSWYGSRLVHAPEYFTQILHQITQTAAA